MDTNETPTLSEIIKNAIDARLLDVHVSMPARVERYTHNLQKADIKPLLKKKYKTNNGTESELPIIPNVPVCWQNADNGNAYLHMPVKINDIGVFVCCDRSIDTWLSGDGQLTKPDDPRHHSLSDAFFIPGMRPFGNPLQDTTEDEVILQRNNTTYQKMFDSGKIECLAKESRTIMHPDGKRESFGGNMTVKFNPNGTLSITGASHEMLTVIDSWMNHIINDGYILTCFGVSGWIDYTKQLLNQDRSNFQTLME